MGYEKMSERGRLVAELVELLARHDVLLKRAHQIPGVNEPAQRKAPQALLKTIEERYDTLAEAERLAVLDLRTGLGRGRWEQWANEHSKANPGDAMELYLIKENFSGGPEQVSVFVWNRFGPFDRPWRMQHQW